MGDIAYICSEGKVEEGRPAYTTLNLGKGGIKGNKAWSNKGDQSLSFAFLDYDPYDPLLF